MSSQRHDIEALFAQLEAGRLDELSVEQVAALEAAVNDSPALSQRLASVRTPADRLLQARATAPTGADWERTWSAIESSFASQRNVRPAPTGRIYTLGRAAAAAAACVALLVLWRALPLSTTTTTTTDSGGWALAVSDDTEILELEVYDGRSATLHFAGDGSGVVAISIGDPDDSDTGA
jgi:hypothetical protein